MSKNLVIVESPAKARTISRYLGDDYEVVASVGHVRDLPSKKMSVDIENDFRPEYEIMPGKKAIIQNLKKLAKNAEIIYLATDPDREGEAISWHIMEAISTNKQTKRVIFHEITEDGIKKAFKEPTSLNMELVNAQQARRVLDRVVGYQLSPLLWKKFTSGFKLGLSAGRVQSVALKLIVEREREISSFVPREYWNISAVLKKTQPLNTPEFTAKISGTKKYDKSGAEKIENALSSSSLKVNKVSSKTSKSRPPAPFTTSTMQQEASRSLRFQVSRTMRVAQQLYEGLPIGSDGETGLITYMRTDSTNLSNIAIEEMSAFIVERFGNNYIGSGTRPRRKKAAVAAQEAHEAVRPTSILRTPEQLKPYLSTEQMSLYTLIWKRSLASRMADAKNKITTINILATESSNNTYSLTCSGSEPEFDGYTVLYNTIDKVNEEEIDDDIDEMDDDVDYINKLPNLSEGDLLDLIKVNNEQKFTRPNPRYTQATFVRTLEESGIGRPSTYASIMSTLEGRNYCSLENGKYKAEPLGEAIVDQLNPYFPNIMDVQFTAKMESNLDEIANGKKEWISVLREFYDPYRKMFIEAESSMPKITVQRITGESCPECESPLAEKIGRNGKFIACTAFPDCRFSKPFIIKTGAVCPMCSGDILQRQGGKRRTVFYGCSNYPNCDFSMRQKPLPVKCPECSGVLIESARNTGTCVNCKYKGQIPNEKAKDTGVVV